MKKTVLDFIRRGMIAMGIGPIVLAIIYLILQYNGILQTLDVGEVCVGIFSLSALAFVAGGLNALYQIERLPLMVAILIHGAVLYATYLCAYLLNGWLEWGMLPVLVFSAIFVVGYVVIWAIIYCIIKKRTTALNRQLRQRQQEMEIE